MLLEEFITSFKFVANHGDLTKTADGLSRVEKGANKAAKETDGLFKAMLKSELAVGALNMLKDAMWKLGSFTVQTNLSFERIKGALITVTGSAHNATAAFEGIKQFAKTTPFSVQQVADAFIKLKSLGLDPSEEALTSYGNTASAMGKDLMMFVEAIADAVTGENERLKEFGIRADAHGKKIKYTFQGTTTEVEKNAKSIEAYLRKIGLTKFAGAMDVQAKSMVGAFSNAKDALEGFVEKLGGAGLNSALSDVARWISKLTEESDDLARTLGSALGNTIRSLFKAFQALAPAIIQSISIFSTLLAVAAEAASSLGETGLTAVVAGLTTVVVALQLSLAAIPAILTGIVAASVAAGAALGKMNADLKKNVYELSTQRGALMRAGEVAQKIIYGQRNLSEVEGFQGKLGVRDVWALDKMDKNAPQKKINDALARGAADLRKEAYDKAYKAALEEGLPQAEAKAAADSAQDAAQGDILKRMTRARRKASSAFDKNPNADISKIAQSEFANTPQDPMAAASVKKGGRKTGGGKKRGPMTADELAAKLGKDGKDLSHLKNDALRQFERTAPVVAITINRNDYHQNIHVDSPKIEITGVPGESSTAVADRATQSQMEVMQKAFRLKAEMNQPVFSR